MSTAPEPVSVVSPTIFFELVNHVLRALGREELQDGSPHRKVIEVRPNDRVLQILAGPGSGKTEALVLRALYELLVLGTLAARVMVTTFTKRAAVELQVRVVERADEFARLARDLKGINICDPQVHSLRIGTIHSLCDQLLGEFDTAYVEAGTQVVDEAETAFQIARSYRYALGYSTPPDRPRVLNRLEACDPLVALFRPPWEERWPYSLMERVDFISSLLAQHTETWIPRCEKSEVRNGVECVHDASGLTEDLRKLQTRWEHHLDEHGVLDFATIQKRFANRQRNFTGILDHVLVDEFQDSNPIQFGIHTQWLRNRAARLTVVGDDDQAIYRFRGSDIACFRGLPSHCKHNAVPYRSETLSTNYRSTRSIVAFTEEFRRKTVLSRLSMPKSIGAGPRAAAGSPVRLLVGPWSDLCALVSEELDMLGAGRPQTGEVPPPSVAILAFSTSEKEYRDRKSPALALRRAIQSRGMKIYNPRNKTAGNNESPVSMLLGLISYLVDPVSRAPIGKGGRPIEVWASCVDTGRADHAKTCPPPFPINQHHAALQKAFVKGGGGKIGAPTGRRAEVLKFVDEIRTGLAQLPAGEKGRLTLSGFVSRLLAFPLFRQSGYTVDLFRQALFTQLLEANTAPTRLTRDPLDQPLEVTPSGGKLEWPKRYWTLLGVFGGYLENTNLDDLEVETFEEDAVLMITFHQSKGLEFDHVYVAATGRNIDIGPPLRTQLFSGTPVPYTVTGGLQTTDKRTLSLAEADREREVYVALTRAKGSLTVLHDPALQDLGFYSLNPAIGRIFDSAAETRHPTHSTIVIKEISNAGRH